MSNEEFEVYLRERFEDQVKWYDGKAKANQRKYGVMQWLAIGLSALTPVLIELEFSGYYGHIPTITASVVAVLTAGLKTFKYHENWVSYRATCESLQRERHYYNARIGDYGRVALEDDRHALFVERVEALIGRENQVWLAVQRRERRESGRFDGA